MKETTADKAHRLSKHVQEVPGVKAYWVPSGDGERKYLVVLAKGMRFCACKHGQEAFAKNMTPRCSHMGAVALDWARQQVPADVLDGIPTAANPTGRRAR